MRYVWFWLTLSMLPRPGIAFPELELTPQQRREVLQRTLRFRNLKDNAVLNESPPHYDGKGRRLPDRGFGPSRSWRLQDRERWLTRRQTWEAVQAKDWLPLLADTWIAPEQLRWDPTYLPQEGKSNLALWSSSYWSLQLGATSYRPAENKRFFGYDEAVTSYAQPREWREMLTWPIDLWAHTVRRWSPAEKWDLTVGDTWFNLTRQQKGAGAWFRENNNNVPSWMGLCHGWAAASLYTPKPVRAVDVVGANGVRVRWFPDDIKAMAALAWANGSARANYLGGRCDAKEAETFPNGRLKQPECFDANPSAFYLALANLVGRKGGSFIMDSAFDLQVWNYPIVGYQFLYFDPMNPERTSRTWSDVAVDYDAAFKAQDRFQNPLTRGVRDAAGNYYDQIISKVVGVAATVAYLSGNSASGSEAVSEDVIGRTTYTFDLELQQHARGYWALGGEWHQNGHPDFLWVPQAGASPSASWDEAPGTFTGLSAPSEALTQAALEASKKGYPLCRVLKTLVDTSSGTTSYRCPRG